MNHSNRLTSIAAALALAACAPASTDRASFACPENVVRVERDEPARSDGEVAVSADGRGFRATQVVSIANGFGGARQAEVDFSTVNGSVGSCATGQGGYGIQVHLAGRGATEQEARDALASMVVQHDDVLVGDLLRIATRVEFRETAAGQILPLPVGLPIGADGDAGRQRSASIAAALPAAPSYVFRHNTTNGLIVAGGFHGTAADLSATNGGVWLDGVWDQAALDTTNGPIELSGDFAVVTADTTNGHLLARLDTRRSVNADFNTTNSGMEVALAPGSAGYDLYADTTNGRASIRVRGAAPVGEQQDDSAHHMTPDYASRPVKVEVRGKATNGDVSIHD